MICRFLVTTIKRTLKRDVDTVAIETGNDTALRLLKFTIKTAILITMYPQISEFSAKTITMNYTAETNSRFFVS